MTEPGRTTEQNLWQARPLWQKVVIIVIGLGIIGAILSDGDEAEVQPVAAPTTVAETTVPLPEEPPPPTTEPATTTTAVATTTTTEATTTTVIASWESFTVDGSGDDFFEFSIPGDDAAVLEITHAGSSNIAVTTYTAGNERLDLLVNDVGLYEGRVPVNFLAGEEVGLLEITASGPWTITAIPLIDLDVHFGEAAGRGDDVVIVEVPSPMLHATHDGQSNFVVLAWSDRRDLLVNEIGPYDATVRSPTGTVVFEINADGNWTITSG